MAGTVGYATLQIIPSARGFRAAVESQVNPDMGAAGATAGKQFGSSMGSQFKAMLGPLAATFGAMAAGNFIKGSISAASDLNETITKTEQIFGSTSGAILEWSKNSATALGQSRTQALDAASTFAIFGKGAGLAGSDLVGFSTKLSSLSADFSSFYNSSPEEAITAIGAALRGESEPIRRFGVLLNDQVLKQEAMKLGIIKTTSEALNPQARALAAYQVIMNQSKDAQGDFARTADGVANSSRTVSARFADLKVLIGNALLPVVKQLLTVTGKLIQFIIAIPGPIKVFIGVFATVATTLFLVNKAIAATRVGLTLLKATIMANPIGLLVTVVVSLAAALVYAYKKSETFRSIINGVFRAIAPVVGTVIGYVIGMISSMVKVWTVGIRTMLLVLSKLPKVGPIAKKALDGLDGFTGKLDDLAKNAKAATIKFGANLKDELPKATKDGTKAAKDALAATQGDFTLAGADLSAAVAAGAASGAKKTASAFAKSLASAIGSGFAKAIQGSQDTIKQTFTKLNELVTAQGNKKMIAAVAAAQKKMLDLAGKRDVLREQYKAATENLDNLKKEAADYLKTVQNAVVETGNIANARSFTSLVRNLTGAVTKAKAFSEVVAGLKNSGLNNTSLKQIVDAGPAAGLKAAKALLASGAAGINTVNSLQSELEAQGASIGKTISGSIYDAAIADAQSTVDTIGGQLTKIEDQMVGVAAAFAKELAKIGSIPAPLWLADLIGVTNYTAKTASAFTSPKGSSSSNSSNPAGVGSKTVVVNNYNPIAEPSSITTSRTLTRLAVLEAR